jgi:hypothetical protein
MHESNLEHLKGKCWPTIRKAREAIDLNQAQIGKHLREMKEFNAEEKQIHRSGRRITLICPSSNCQFKLTLRKQNVGFVIRPREGHPEVLYHSVECDLVGSPRAKVVAALISKNQRTVQDETLVTGDIVEQVWYILKV